METLESLERRIARTDDLQSVVKSMKALAAAKVRQYEQTADSIDVYRQTIELGLQVALRGRGLRSRGQGDRQAGQRYAIVVGSDQGLCGQFNDEIVAFAGRRLAQDPGAGRPLVISVGHQPAVRLAAGGVRVKARLPVPQSTGTIGETVGDLLVQAESWRQEGEGVRILLFYNRRRGGAATRPHGVPIWPLDLDWLRELETRPWQSHVLPTYSLGPDELLAILIRQHLFAVLFRGLAESMAGEQASRLSAMQVAEQDIDDRLVDLRKQHQQQRQRAITDELLDIIAGREALAGR